MTLTIHWMYTGVKRTYPGVTQRLANQIINLISRLQEEQGEVGVKICVE